MKIPKFFYIRLISSIWNACSASYIEKMCGSDWNAWYRYWRLQAMWNTVKYTKAQVKFRILLFQASSIRDLKLFPCSLQSCKLGPPTDNLKPDTTYFCLPYHYHPMDRLGMVSIPGICRICVMKRFWKIFIQSRHFWNSISVSYPIHCSHSNSIQNSL